MMLQGTALISRHRYALEPEAYLVKPFTTTLRMPSRLAYSMYASQTAKSPGNLAVARFRMYTTRRGIEYVEALGGGGFRS